MSGLDMQEVELKIKEGKANQLKVKELKEYLKAKGENDKGKKQELIERVSKRIKTN